MIPEDGKVTNGIFWLDGDTWLIFNNEIPLTDFLKNQLKESDEYISRLTIRANKLREWLDKNAENA